MTIRIIVSALVLSALSILSATAGDDTTATRSLHKYIPEFHGTVRVFYEQSTTDGAGRFSVRNARLSAGGYVLPKVDYLLQVDFCDRGSIKLLDAYVSLRPVRDLRLMAGQMRVPFGIDASRSPHAYFFMNRSFVGKGQGNLRSVGFKAGYTLPVAPIYIEAGIFNATDRSDHSTWNKRFTFGAKLRWDTSWGFTPQVALMGRAHADAPGAHRLTLYDASLSWHDANWWVEAEYERTEVHGFEPCDVVSAFAQYGFDTRCQWMNRLSFETRFDASDATTDGVPDASGTLAATHPARKRLTVGTTATYRYGKMQLHFRINYEQYFYNSGTIVSANDNSRLGCALMLHF